MVQEVTTQSWFQRIGNAFLGIFIGIACVIGAFVLIFWNESHGLHTAQSLQQTERVLISVPAQPINAQNENKVIYTSDVATTTDTLTDSLLNYSAQALKLNREVNMYQWKENVETHTEQNLGGSEREVKDYTYEKVWSPDWIDSGKFKDSTNHQNPATMPLHSKMQQAANVKVGDFVLSKDFIDQISGAEAINLNNDNVTAVTTKINKKATLQDEQIYVGNDTNNPEIGDLKIQLFQILPQKVSVIGLQSGNSLQEYTAPAGQNVGLLSMGVQSSQAMIHEAESENRMMMWIWRGVALLLMIVGISLMLRPIVVLADVVPFFGSIVGFGTGLVSFGVGISLWLVAIGIAWFAVRPLFAIGLIVVAILFCFVLLPKIRKKKVS